MIYPRPHPAEFAIDAPESEIQAFPDWARGLGIAFDETNGFPEMTGINGLFQIITEYIKYLEQNGFAEWSASLEYPIGAGVRVGSIWYRAKTQNINKPPATSQNDWAVFLNASDLTYGDPLQINVSGQVTIKDATTTQKGVIRFANSSEIANRANVSAAITPANVGQTFSQSLATNGWCRLPNGLIMQWGTSSSPSVVFPRAFDVNCFNIVGSYIDRSYDTNLFAVMSKNKTSFETNTLTRTYSWQAIGA